MTDGRCMSAIGYKSNGCGCQNHLFTKLTMTCVGFDLLAHISACKNVARIQPIFSEFTVNLIFFFELQPFAGLGEQIISRQCGPFIFSKKSQPIFTFLKFSN